MLVGAIAEEPILRLRELDRPMVLVDNNLPHLGLDRVLTENVGGVYRAVAHLHALGHRRIAFLCGAPGDPSMGERLAGYRAAVGRLGLAPDEIPHGGPGLPAAAGQSIAAWLGAPAAQGCTAIVAYNDDAAIGVLHALADHGLRVPDDISVVGFDDIDTARIIRPALTTCHVERERLGKLGVRALMARAADPAAPTHALVQDVTLIERASTRRIAE
jgi:DNA-binding LacI/PurR family transcriptional regulator